MKLLNVVLGLTAVAGATLAVACGDGTPRAEGTPTVTADGPLPTVAVPRATATNAPLPTPIPAKDTDLVLNVGASGKSLSYTATEFRALPTIEIEAGGEKRRGVSLASLALAVEARSGATITVEGRAPDLSRSGLWRGSLGAFGASAVLSIDDRGVVTLSGSSIPKEQWLAAVTGVGFE